MGSPHDPNPSPQRGRTSERFFNNNHHARSEDMMTVTQEQVIGAIKKLGPLLPVGGICSIDIVRTNIAPYQKCQYELDIWWKNSDVRTKCDDATLPTILTGAIMAELHEKEVEVCRHGLWQICKPLTSSTWTVVCSTSAGDPFDALIDLYVQYRKSIDKPKFDLMPNPCSVWRGHDIDTVRVVGGVTNNGNLRYYVVGASTTCEIDNQQLWDACKGECLYGGIKPAEERRWTK